MDLIDYLSGRIGVRFAGTENERKAALCIAEQFEKCGLEVEVDTFRFMGWELLEKPKLQVISPVKMELPCVVPIYSAPTSEDGASGKVEMRGRHYNSWYRELTDKEKYAIVNGDGEDVGYFLAVEEEALVSGLGENPQFTVSMVYVGKNDCKPVRDLLVKGKKVTAELSVKSRFKPGAVSRNVIGTLKGKDSERFVIVSSHYDTVYDSPGANDDASAVQALLFLAEQFKGETPPYTIKFIAYGAEEMGLLGSRHYAKKLIEMSMLDKVIAVINLDEIGVETQNHKFRASNEPLKSTLIEVLKRLDVERRIGSLESVVEDFPMKKVTISWNSDYAPFVQEGVPTISIGGEDPKTHHREIDTPEVVSRETVTFKSEVVRQLLREIFVGEIKPK